MDTNRIFLRACIASLALCATAAGAQTIYKQVDPEGRVMFTDQPNPGARVVASYETARPAKRADSEMEEQAVPPVRTNITETDLNPTAHVVMGAVATRNVAGWPSRPAASSVPSPSAPSPREAERAANTYTPLQSASALQVDANESARRARQELQKDPAAGVLIVKPAPRERDPASRYEGFTAFYVMWAVTFFLLAAGLLYFGWQIFRLILRTAFPRWQLGLG